MRYLLIAWPSHDAAHHSAAQHNMASHGTAEHYPNRRAQHSTWRCCTQKNGMCTETQHHINQPYRVCLHACVSLAMCVHHVCVPVLQDYEWRDFVRGKDLIKYLREHQELLDTHTKPQGQGGNVPAVNHAVILLFPLSFCHVAVIMVG